jgi:energy-converting hydrogenase Eha subunit B
MLGSLGAMEIVLIVIVVVGMALLVVWPACRVCAKAGYPMALGVLAVVPLANVVLLCFLGFVEWPTDKERLRPGGKRAI